MQYIFYLVALLTLLIGNNAYAAGMVTPQDVLQSARLYSPKILNAKEAASIADASTTEALGAFDASVEQEIFSRIDGFYDGQQFDTQLVKPLEAFNSSVFTGYRVADGSFPIYEDQRITAEDGEWMIGMRMSLLRNRDIDPRRLALFNARLEQDAVQAGITKSILEVQEEALLYYWDWVAAGLSYQVYQELLDIAVDRQKAFKARVMNGDLPKIYLTENKQYILQREANLNAAERKLLQSANKLSLYYRDDAGDPLVALPNQLPGAFIDADSIKTLESLDDLLARRPELREIAVEMSQLDNQIDYGTNLRLPAANLEVKHANDYGSGPPSREEAETIFKFNVSIPLQQRKADGYTNQAKAKKRQLEHKRRQLMEQLRAQLDNVFVTLRTARDFIDITKEEISLAKKMQDAEQIRINNGDSDYFLLVIRDENLAKAQIKHISAQSLYQQARARIYALTMDLDALGLNEQDLRTN